MKVRLLLFASLRDRLGTDEETVDLQEGASVADLAALLGKRGGEWAAALSPQAPVRAAVDQQFVGMDEVLREGCEVALFPPVTGG